MPTVVLTNPVHPSAHARLAEEATVRVAAATDEVTLCREVAGADALIVRAPITPAVLRAGRRLKVVARHGVGLDFIPVADATALRIAVTYTPDANTESVAEHVIGGFIALAHRFAEADRAARSGHWHRRHDLIGVDLRGRTLGIIGLGRIGARVAEIARLAFAMRIMAHDPMLSADAIRALGAEPAPLDQLLSEAEFITVHCPLTEATKGLIDAGRFARMRRGVYFANAARGPIVDDRALADALRSGHVRAAFLDVFAAEPPEASDPLLGLDQVLITPHSAAHTEEAMTRMGVHAVEDVLRVLRGERPKYCVNEEVLAE
jgi:D-3-phosphoglycerate dehydrogenase / 2-oxoglutarate reductase